MGLIILMAGLVIAGVSGGLLAAIGAGIGIVGLYIWLQEEV
jgi:hypothetical protein